MKTMATPKEQLQAMRHLTENWDGYGAAAPQARILDLAQEFVSLLDALLRKSTLGACCLHVNPTRIGGVLIEWENASSEHEVQIDPDGSFSFLQAQV